MQQTLQEESLEELKSRQVSLDRQIAALRDLEDGRSVSTLKDLKDEATMVRHAITLKKPPKLRAQVLEDAIAKKKESLKDAQKLKEQAQATINTLRVEIVQAETELEKAQLEAVTADQNVELLRAQHLGMLTTAATQLGNEEAAVFNVLLKK
eukprot:11165760-Karenia_brevis.AAC.1